MMIETSEMNDSRGYFRIYTISEISSAGIPTIITTAGAVYENGFRTDYWFLEYFILIPNVECIYYKKLFSFDAGAIPENLVKVDSEFMLRQAYELARYKMANHFSRSDENTVDKNIVHKMYKLNELETNEMAGLWIRNQCTDIIRQIHKETKCQSLKRMLGYIIKYCPTLKESKT